MIRRPPRSTLFPSRRSSDLQRNPSLSHAAHSGESALGWAFRMYRDRKSTRLNSSHANISYAVFCLKKKKVEALRVAIEFDLGGNEAASTTNFVDCRT